MWALADSLLSVGIAGLIAFGAGLVKDRGMATARDRHYYRRPGARASCRVVAIPCGRHALAHDSLCDHSQAVAFGAWRITGAGVLLVWEGREALQEARTGETCSWGDDACRED